MVDHRFGLKPFYKTSTNGGFTYTYVDYDGIEKYLQSREASFIFRENIQECTDCEPLFFVVYIPYIPSPSSSSPSSPFRIVHTAYHSTVDERLTQHVTAVAVPKLCSIVTFDPSRIEDDGGVSNASNVSQVSDASQSLIQAAEYYMMGHIRKLLLPQLPSEISALSINQIPFSHTSLPGGEGGEGGERGERGDGEAWSKNSTDSIDYTTTAHTKAAFLPHIFSTRPSVHGTKGTYDNTVLANIGSIVASQASQRYDISSVETLLVRLADLRAMYMKTLGMLDVLIEVNGYDHIVNFLSMKASYKEAYRRIMGTLVDIDGIVNEFATEVQRSHHHQPFQKMRKFIYRFICRNQNQESAPASPMHALDNSDNSDSDDSNGSSDLSALLPLLKYSYYSNSSSAFVLDAEVLDAKIREVYTLTKSLYDDPSGPSNRFQFDVEEAFALFGPFWVPLLVPTVKYIKLLLDS